MATFVVRPNGILQYDLFISGQRFREGTGLPDTPANRQRMRRNIKRINAELETGVFSYAKWFPNSRKVEAAERLLRENRSNDPGQRFGRYAWSWYEMCKGDWKPAYRTRVARNLRGHIVPFLGDYPVDQIDERALRLFRQSLLAETRPDGRRAFSNSRVTNLMAHLSAILNLAERELGIDNPIKYLSPLADDRKDPKPLTVDQVHAFLRAVDPRMRLYFEVRFYTGLRGGVPEQPEHPLDALLFTDFEGRPLDPSRVSKEFWLPTLKCLGLERRRVYETRHTAAVLHLAAGENPLFVSRLLGHADSAMLFNVYAPFVPNIMGRDGEAFEALMADNGADQPNTRRWSSSAPDT